VKRFAILASVILASVAGYAFFIEPNWLEVTHHSVEMNLSQPVKVAHLTDLHLHRMGKREREVLSILSKEMPDLIVITGDTLDDPNFAPIAFEFISRLSAPLGVWASGRLKEIGRIGGPLSMINRPMKKLTRGC